jgi:tetratricopeptide (TPR) repeat protein
MAKEHSKVRAWEDTLTLPTYELGPEDPNPPLLMKRRNLIHPGSSIVYPYPLQEDLRNRCADKVWKAFLLENDFLKITILPELGGRLASVWDKTAGREALYRNHSVRYARIGIRGAFFSGGIEWNFPNGHTVTTSSVIDCAIRENQGGSATILFGDIERVSRMRWSVGITLFPEYASFETEIRLFNRTPLPNRYWFWANSAAPVSPRMQYVSTSSKVSDLTHILDFPIHDGVDLSWDANHPEPQDMFGLNHRDDFGAWYDHGIERGLVNVADRTEARGLKFFTWGNGDDGGIWQERLTDSDGPYAEMQSGRFSTQRIWEMLPPFTEESWKETWYPITRIGAPAYANREAAISIVRAESSGHLRIGVHPTSARNGARLSVVQGSRPVWERTVDLSPARPLLEDIPVTGPAADLTVSLADADGKLLARCIAGSKDAPELPIKSYVHIEPRQDGKSPRELWRAARDYEKLGELETAGRLYGQALSRDPDFSPGELGMGVLKLRQGLLEPAMARFRKVLEADPSEEEARFHLAGCLILSERYAEAIEELKLVVRSRVYRPGSIFLLGGLFLGQGNPRRAAAYLETCMREYPWHLDAAAFLACALRMQNDPGGARTILRSNLRQDPLHFPALAEAYFLALESTDDSQQERSRAELRKALRDEPQSYLELGCDYARFGLHKEASSVLALYAGSDPLVRYHQAFYAEILGRSDAPSLYAQAGKADPHYVFPHRLESERVLRRAVEAAPGNGKARYYLGNLLCSLNRPEEAIECWKDAAKTESAFSVLHRNLGRAYWKVLRDPHRSLSEYRTAIACSPHDYKLYLEMEKILVACGLENERRDLIGSIPAGLMANDLIAERVASFHADCADFDRALAILDGTYFFPWEVYRGVRFLYMDACIGKGIQLLRQDKAQEAVASFRKVMVYPRTIGVGESRYKANAEAWYRIGVAQEKTGDVTAARESWRQAAEEPRPVPDALCYYRARALQKLGQEKEAGAAVSELLVFAQGNIGDGAEKHYIAGLAHKASGDSVKSLQSFTAAISISAAHRRSRWEISGFTGAD